MRVARNFLSWLVGTSVYASVHKCLNPAPALVFVIRQCVCVYFTAEISLKMYYTKQLNKQQIFGESFLYDPRKKSFDFQKKKSTKVKGGCGRSEILANVNDNRYE